MDCSTTVFIDEFSTFSVILPVLGHPECSSSSTDTRLALKHVCHSKTAVQLKEMFSKSLTKHFKGFGSGFTKLQANLMQIRCSILPSIADKTKHEVEKELV
jgi:hypothetical protein